MRIPLYLKLMASYLFVFALVFVPTFYFLRTGLVEEVQKVLRTSLEQNLASVTRQLAALPARRVVQTVDALVRAMPERLTVVDAQGTVMGDSVVASKKVTKLENHIDRPEILDALANGTGFAIRKSKTTGTMLMYGARRFPESGTPRGIVRLALSIDQGETAGKDLSSFINHSGALALSAAVLLSLLAAMVVSRPLRRIAASARAFAAGDFGYQVNVHSRDELGEVAQALEELAAQLRGRLVEAGADRTTLRALLDDLPVGVVLFDAQKRAVVLNGRAREICSLSPAHELDDANRLLQLADQAEVVERVLRTTVSEEVPLTWTLPGAPAVLLLARWVSVAGVSGEPLPAVILRERDPGALPGAALRLSMARWSASLRDAANEVETAQPGRAAALTLIADDIERSLPEELPTAGAVEVVSLGSLCARAMARVQAAARSRNVELACELAEPETRIVEAGERVERALASMLDAAARSCEPGVVVLLRDELEAAHVRMRLRVVAPAWDTSASSAPLSSLGGDAGAAQDRDVTEAWIVVPRA